jgi:hypothetical protein
MRVPPRTLAVTPRVGLDGAPRLRRTGDVRDSCDVLDGQPDRPGHHPGVDYPHSDHVPPPLDRHRLEVFRPGLPVQRHDDRDRTLDVVMDSGRYWPLVEQWDGGAQSGRAPGDALRERHGTERARRD